MDSSPLSQLHGFEVAASDHRRDRLSELPESLKLVILSLLPVRYAILTALLSKAWKDLWTSIPCLDFEHPSYCYDLENFRNFVSGALAAWKGSKILKFRLSCRIDDCFVTSDILDSWLLFAIEKQVEELHIRLMPDLLFHSDLIEYFAPCRLYTCSSLTNLSLGLFNLREVQHVQLDQLVSFKLDVAGAAINEDALNQILAGAPRLQILKLRVWGLAENLNIQSSSLKVVEVQIYGVLNNDINGPMLTIDAPNLETLEMFGIRYQRCLLNVPSLTHAVLDFRVAGDKIWRDVFLSILHVENVTLSDSCVEGLCEMKKKDVLLSFPNAKFLKFVASAAHQILDVVEMFPQLKTLVVELKDVKKNHMTDKFLFNRTSNTSLELEPQTDLTCSLLHLTTVEVTWFLRDVSIYLVIENLLKNARVLEKMVFRPISFDIPKSNFRAPKKLLSMPRSSPTTEVIIVLD